MTWCHVPETAYPSAQAALDWIWVSVSPSPTSTPGHMSNGTNTLDRSSSPHNGPDTSPPRQSGTTSPHSTPVLSPDRSTPFSPDTPASHLARPDSAAEKTTSGTYGQTSPVSPMNSGKASTGSTSKTSQDMSASAQRPCCESYETWVSRLRLAYSQRKKQARRMSGLGGSVWPTAKAVTGGANSQREAQGAGGPDLQEAVRNWTTPQAHDISPRGSGQVPTSKAGNACLARDAQMWATPAAGLPNYDEPVETFKARGEALMARGYPKQGANLGQQAQTWPTPARRDYKGENSPDHLENGTGRLHLDQLPNAVAHSWHRPVPQTATHGLPSSQYRPISRRLFRSVTSHVALTSLRRWLRRGNWRKRRLNALFVEWLMAWPPGHALSSCSVTVFTRWQQDMRGALSQLPTASGAWIWEPPAEVNETEQLALF